ncbi:glycosyltransferase [Raineyella sp.]|uniref:glycosyltransferase n=1 Tax=Raineyella sp. TaxID=1911550 RepID=UPI002B1F3A8F|nr:glycosyltransferase [Raineyella sp.]MEA5153887.1 glycosyltransferase [Raineyella sp.]
MPHLSIATLATDAPMGAQVYQEEIASRAAAALEALEPGWTVDRTIARSLRSPLPGNRRLPMGWLTHASPAARRVLGRSIYPRGAVVHRMNLELPPAPGADVITLHDVVSWRFPDESAPVAAAAEEARRADAVICVSRFSAQEAVDLLGIADPYVVHNGVDDRFFRAEPLGHDRLTELGVTGPYVLTAGGASRRKNLDGLAAAWPKVHSSRPDLTLVLSGPEHPRRTELFGGMPGVRLVGRVPDTTVPGLIAAAAAVVVPSRYEGFGLPALEGMAAGVPVVAARTSSLPEVVGDGGILVEPTPDELAEGIIFATSGDAALGPIVDSGRRRARRFTWETSAAGHARVWATVGA